MSVLPYRFPPPRRVSLRVNLGRNSNGLRPNHNPTVSYHLHHRIFAGKNVTQKLCSAPQICRHR
jgi:hypothetical protein